MTDSLIHNLMGILENAKRILVITNCTKEKAVDMREVKSKLAKLNLQTPSFDLDKEPVYRDVLQEFIKPARDMYVGQTIKPVKELVKTLKSCGKYVDFYIISARYGIIGENDLIIPYEAKLDASNKEKLKKWSEERKVVSKLQDIVAKGGYDLAIIILSRAYALALGEFFEKTGIPHLVIVVAESVLKTVKLTTRAIQLPVKGRQHMKYTKIMQEAVSKICQNRFNTS